jgi:hypothetical protein
MSDYSSHHSLAGKIGGLTRAALGTNEEYRKARAAEGRMKRFLDQVPADVTDPTERMRRAELLQRAHMTRIAKKSAESRRTRRGRAA